MTEKLEILPASHPIPKPKEPWLQQAGESNKDYTRFLIYRDMGKDRSIAKAEAECRGKPLKATPSGGYNDLAKKNSWVERAQAWDLAQAEKASQIIQSATDEALQETQENIKGMAKIVGKVIKASDLAEVKGELQKLVMLFGKGGAGAFTLESSKVLAPPKTGTSGRMVMVEFDC